jgi:hypothetical protein
LSNFQNPKVLPTAGSGFTARYSTGYRSNRREWPREMCQSEVFVPAFNQWRKAYKKSRPGWFDKRGVEKVSDARSATTGSSSRAKLIGFFYPIFLTFDLAEPDAALTILECDLKSSESSSFGRDTDPNNRRW